MEGAEEEGFASAETAEVEGAPIQPVWVGGGEDRRKSLSCRTFILVEMPALVEALEVANKGDLAWLRRTSRADQTPDGRTCMNSNTGRHDPVAEAAGEATLPF